MICKCCQHHWLYFDTLFMLQNPIQMFISLTGSLLRMSSEIKGSQLTFIPPLLQTKGSVRFSKNAILFSLQNNSLYPMLTPIVQFRKLRQRKEIVLSKLSANQLHRLDLNLSLLELKNKNHYSFYKTSSVSSKLTYNCVDKVFYMSPCLIYQHTTWHSERTIKFDLDLFIYIIWKSGKRHIQ